MNVLLIPGTNSFSDPWCRPTASRLPGGPPPALSFADAVVDLGHRVVGDARPFEWSTDLGGIGLGDADLRVWKAAGAALYDYVSPPRESAAAALSDLIIVAHSHARQVVLFALEAGMRLDLLITVGSPIRADVDKETPGARRNVSHWVHLHAGWRDYWQILGEAFDGGGLGWRRKEPQADENVELPAGSTHGGALRDPRLWPSVLIHLPRNGSEGRSAEPVAE